MRHDPEGSANGAAWQAGFRCVTTPFWEEDLVLNLALFEFDS
jgi:hypothetical protein